jgi:hypothetical protein
MTFQHNSEESKEQDMQFMSGSRSFQVRDRHSSRSQAKFFLLGLRNSKWRAWNGSMVRDDVTEKEIRSQ